MVQTVTEAVYRARVEGQAAVDGLTKSVEGLSVSEEKLTRATRSTEQGFERLIAKVDPAARAYQQYQRTLEQVDRYEAAGIGTQSQRAQVIDLATKKYIDQVSALERAAQAQDQYNRAAQSANSASTINSRLGVRSDFGTTERGADVAAYGQQLDALRAKYNPLFAAGQTYKAQLADINMALRVGAINESEHAAAMARTKSAFVNQVGYIKSGTDANRLYGGSLTQLSFQINDIASGLAMGQSPFQILTQQGGQVFQVWQMNRSVFSDLKAAVLGFLTPARLALGVVAAIGVALYATYASWKAYAKQLDDVSRVADTTSRSMSGLQNAAAFKGIDSKEFFSSAEKFSADIYQAKIHMGGLAELLHANGQSAGTFEETLGRVADIVKNAASEQQKIALLQKAGLPATSEWVRFMSQGAEGIRRASDESVKLGGRLSDDVVKKAREFDEAWDQGWNNFANSARDAISKAKGWFEDLRRSANRKWQDAEPGVFGLRIGNAIDDVGDFANKDMKSALERRAAQIRGSGASVDPAELQRRNSLEQQYIGLLGQTASVSQQVRNTTLQIAQYQMQPGAISLTESQIQTLKDLARQRALGIDVIKASTDAQNVEAVTIGMSAGAVAEYTAVQNRLNEAKRNSQILTVEEVAAIKQSAAALGEAAQRTDNLKTGYSIFSSTMQDLNQNIRQNGLNWTTLGTVATNALGKISDKLMQMSTDKLWEAAFGGSSSGLGSLFSSLFSSSAAEGGNYASNAAGAVTGSTGMVVGGLRSGGMVGIDGTPTWVHPAYYDNAPHMRNGGMITDDGIPIVAHPGERVLNRTETAAYNSGNGKSASSSITISPVYQIDARGSQMTEAQFKAILADNNKQVTKDIARSLPDQVAAINSDPRRR